jgi:hypothetical protein
MKDLCLRYQFCLRSARKTASSPKRGVPVNMVFVRQFWNTTLARPVGTCLREELNHEGHEDHEGRMRVDRFFFLVFVFFAVGLFLASRTITSPVSVYKEAFHPRRRRVFWSGVTRLLAPCVCLLLIGGKSLPLVEWTCWH